MSFSRINNKKINRIFVINKQVFSYLLQQFVFYFKSTTGAPRKWQRQKNHVDIFS